ncbi:MAG: DinB family protein [Bryobacteraceae bacterium]|nr:DinB family protein [Bryobacteraceae bacterium]
MTPEQAAGLLQYFLPALQQESATTAKVLAAVPDDKADYAPAEKSMTAQKLASHIAETDMWFLKSVAAGKFEMPGESPAKAPSEAAAEYSSQMPGLIEALKALTPEQLAAELDFYTWKLPAVAYVDFCIRHMIHHRGQLSAYLRPMGAKVPSIYGGSADEPMSEAAAG